MRSLIAYLIAIGAVGAVGAVGASEGPTPFEVASLCHLNRLRADPAGEAPLLARLGTELPDAEGVDFALFEQELAACEPAPPVVMEPAALRAARAHSAYMARHGIGHGEEPGLEGYTGRDLGERLEHVAFPGRAGAENVLRSARSALHGHLAFTIDWGEGGSGGMQAGRGHRVAMLRPRFNVVGLGAVAHGDGLHAVTHAFGSVDGRFIGVVAYADDDRDGRYDPGEGRPLRVTLDDERSGSSGPDGMVTLRLHGRRAGEAVLEADGRRQRIAWSAGILNHWVEWRLPSGEGGATDAQGALLGPDAGSP